MIGQEALGRLADGWFGALAPLAIEAAVVGLLLWCVVRAGRRLPSPVRYGLLLVALLKFLLPPVSAPWSMQLALPTLSYSLPHAGRPAGQLPPASLLPEPPASDEPWISAEPSVSATTMAARTPAAGPAELPSFPSPVVRPQPPRVVLPSPTVLLLLLQLAGAVVLVARRAAQLRTLWRCERRSRVGDDAQILGTLLDTCRRQRLRRVPELLVSPDNVGPAASGLWRRRLLLPQRLIGRMSPDSLRPVIAHEVAHHRRGDLWIDALAFAGGLVWWLHPVYWLLHRELRRLREDCCDEAAIAESRSASAYCQSLLDIAALVRRDRPALAAVAHGSLSHPLGRRIRRMMNDTFCPSPRLSVPGLVLLVSIALLLGPSLVASAQPPSIEPGAAAGAASSGQQRERHSWGRNVWWGVDNGEIELSDGAIDELVQRGLDRAFLEQLDGSQDRDLSLDELRDWSRYGVDAELATELETMGVRRVRVSDVLRLAWSDVDAAYVRGLREAGLTEVDLGEIVRLARYDVEPGYIADFRSEGYTELDVDDLVRLRRYEVEPGYAGTYRQAGYELSVDDLVRLHRYEVDEDAVARLSSAGLTDFSVDDLVRLQRYEVSDQFIRAMTRDGDVELDVDDLVTLKRYEVDPDFARELSDAGLQTDTDSLVRLKRYEVDPAMVARLAELGHDDLSVDDLVRLQRYGVDLDYIGGLRALGYSELSVDDLVTLQRYEVDLASMEALGAAGYARLPVGDVVRLNRYSVTANYIRGMAGAGSRQFDVDELVTLRRYEIEPSYVAGLAGVGFGEISVSDMVRLKRYEVDPDFIARLREAGFEELTIDKVIRLKRANG